MICANCRGQEADGAKRCTQCGALFQARRAVWSRFLAAVAAGSLIYLCIFYRGLSYEERSHDQGASHLIFVFAGLMLTAGFAVTLHAPRWRYAFAACLLAGFFASQMGVIMLDWQTDPTRHNLFPFEFLILGSMAVPLVCIGACCAHAVDYFKSKMRRRGTQSLF
jgi:uncharacterized membrane protein